MYLITLGVGKERMQQFVTNDIAHDLDLLAHEIDKYGPREVYYLRVVDRETGCALLDASPCFTCRPCKGCTQRMRR